MLASSHFMITSLTQDIILSILATIGFIISVVSFVKVKFKKLSLKNHFVNKSYSKVSDQILTMVRVNMVFYMLQAVYDVYTSYMTTQKCAGKSDKSEKCSDVIK